MLYAKLAGLVLLSLLRLKEMEAEVQYGIRYRDAEAERSAHRMKTMGDTRVIRRSSRGEAEGMKNVRNLFDVSLCGGKACKPSTSDKFSRGKLAEERRYLDTAIDDDYFFEDTLTHTRAMSEARLVHLREVDYGPEDETLAEPPFPLTGDDIAPPPPTAPSVAPTHALSSPPPSISTITIDTEVRTSSPSSETVSMDQVTNRDVDDDDKEMTPSNDNPSIIYDDDDFFIRSHERSPSNDPFDDDFV